MKEILFRATVGCAIILACTLALVLAARGYEVAVPAQVEHNSANISQNDFAQAQAKWNAQKINVYEITADDGRINFRMRVDRTTGNLYLLNLRVEGTDEGVGGLKEALSGVQIKVYGAYSVDSVFDSINKAVAGVSSAPQATNSGATNFTDVDVQFDPDKGYPTRFTEYTRTTPGSHEITWRQKLSDLQLSDLTVIN